MNATFPQRRQVVRFHGGVPTIDEAGRIGSSAPLSLPFNAVTYACPLCGLKGLLAGALMHHVCPAITDPGVAGPHGGALLPRVIQAVLDGDVATLQEPSLAELSSLLKP